MVCRWLNSVVVCLIATAGASVQLQVGDVVYGLSQSTAANTLELVRGPVMAGGGAAVPDFWDGTPFVQSVEFDNYNGVSHNASGNLLGVNFGTSATGGSIYSFSTTNPSVTAGQLIGNTGPTGIGGAVTLSRLGGLSVNPANNRIAVTGNDSGAVYVFDYAPGDTMGAGAALSNGRETSSLFPGSTQGTTWLDNDTVLAFTVDGTIYEVDAAGTTPLSATAAAFVTTAFAGSQFTALAYNPAIAPYLYASYSSFDSGTSTTTNTLYILNPSAGYSLVKQLDLSTSVNTLREIALGPNGELFLGQFGGSTAPGAKIDVLPNVVTNPAGLADNSSFDWYMSTVQSSFNGIDVALGGGGTTVDGDFNNDGLWNCTDINALSAAIASASTDLSFDMNGDGAITAADITDAGDGWLAVGGANNPAQTGGRPFLNGDANLSGGVDGSDFGIWNSSKFTNTSAWCSGDFNASGAVDGSDFGIWNGNKFQSSDSASLVPEPATLVGLLALVAVLLGLRSRT